MHKKKEKTCVSSKCSKCMFVGTWSRDGHVLFSTHIHSSDSNHTCLFPLVERGIYITHRLLRGHFILRAKRFA